MLFYCLNDKFRFFRCKINNLLYNNHRKTYHVIAKMLQ